MKRLKKRPHRKNILGRDRLLALANGLSLNKRALILLFMVFSVILMFEKTTSVHSETLPAALNNNAAFAMAEAKIRGSSSWKPSGWGSGEYLTTLPVIKAGVVLDFETGEVIWSMNLKQKIAPASLSKLATVTTALDIARSDLPIFITQTAADQIPTKLGLIQGENLTLDEAIAAAVMTSANDATEAIAHSLGQGLGGGDSKFMELVNLKLKKLGAIDSNFTTATGLDDPNHYSTIYDLALVAHDAKANYPIVAGNAATVYKRLDANQNHKLYDLPNWNALLGTYPGVDGLKIGYTENAGYSTIVTAERDGKKLMAVVIGANSIEDREKAAATLLNYGFEKYGIAAYPVDNLDLTKRFNDWKEQLTAAN